MKKLIWIIIVVLIIVGGFYLLRSMKSSKKSSRNRTYHSNIMNRDYGSRDDIDTAPSYG